MYQSAQKKKKNQPQKNYKFVPIQKESDNLSTSEIYSTSPVFCYPPECRMIPFSSHSVNDDSEPIGPRFPRSFFIHQLRREWAPLCLTSISSSFKNALEMEYPSSSSASSHRHHRCSLRIYAGRTSHHHD